MVERAARSGVSAIVRQKLVKLGRGSQVEFQQPITLAPPPASFGDGAGSSIGDAIASAVGDSLTQAIAQTRSVERGAKRTLGRGPQVEFQKPTTLNAPVISFGDGAGSAIGDAVASAQADTLIQAIAQTRSVERGTKRILGRGPQIEFQAPTPLRVTVASFGDGAGAATGDAIAAAGFDALGDFAGAASGDAIASAGFDALGDFAGAASGDSVASGDITGRYDFPLSATCHLLTQQGARRKQREIKEYQRPLTVAIMNDQFIAGSVQGDSIASGTLDALGDFAGAASGDAIASGTFTALGDFAGAASGDAVTSGSLDAIGDFAGAATGDSIANGDITGRYDFPLSATVHLLTSQGARQKQHLVNLEVQRPTPITAFTPAVSTDGAGSAIGDAQADGTLTALGDFAGAATGDAIASGTFTALGDFAGAATGDAIASATASDLADFAGAASGDAIASGTLDALASFAGAASGDAIASATATALGDFSGSAQGDAIASGDFTALGDFAGSAAGDAIASAEGATDNNQDCAGSAIGDATCAGFIEDATPAVVTPPVVVDTGGAGVSVFPGAWNARKPLKKKKRLDELDEMIAELRSRVSEVPVEDYSEEIARRALRVGVALANNPDQASMAAIGNAIVLLRNALIEIDDEEAILLLAA